MPGRGELPLAARGNTRQAGGGAFRVGVDGGLRGNPQTFFSAPRSGGVARDRYATERGSTLRRRTGQGVKGGEPLSSL